MNLRKTKKAMLTLLTAGAFVVASCEWGEGSRDGGMRKAIEFHSTSLVKTQAPVADQTEPSADIELVDLMETDVEEQERSEELMEVAFRHVDDQPSDHVKVAQELIEKSDRAAAMMELGKAIYDNPQDYEATMLLGTVALKSGKTELSKKAFCLATGMDSGKADAWIRLGRIAIKEKDLIEAADCAHQALSVDPKSAESHNLMGRVWLAKSHWERAIRSFTKAVSLSPDNRYYRNNLGLAYLMSKRYDKAVETLETVVTMENIPAFMHNNLGLAYEGAGRLQDAISEFKTAVGMSPSYINAQVNLDRLVTLAKRAEAKIEPVPAGDEEAEDVAGDLIIADPDDN